MLLQILKLLKWKYTPLNCLNITTRGIKSAVMLLIIQNKSIYHINYTLINNVCSEKLLHTLQYFDASLCCTRVKSLELISGGEERGGKGGGGGQINKKILTLLRQVAPW